MKTIKLSMAAMLAMTAVTVSNAQSLAEALQNGKISGDVAVTYEQRNQGRELSNYYQDTAYAVGSIALNYKSATYNNFSAEVGFRAYSNLWQEDTGSTTATGHGDSSERFHDAAGNVALSKAFIAYDANDVHIKIGRQPFYTEWVGKIQDAVSLHATPFENAKLQAIWTKRMGRVYAREFRKFNDLNKNDGVYKVGLEYKFNDNIKTKAYYMAAQDIYDLMGGKITLDTTIGEGSIGTMIHAIETNEDVAGVQDGEMLEVKLYGKYAGFLATVGYVKTGEENGWGSANTAGETIVPFEEADPMYTKDGGSETIYFSLNKQVGPVNLTALYGEIEYGRNDFKEKEFDLWAGYNISENLKMNLGFTVTSADDSDANTTDLTQLNTTFVYKF